MGVAAGKQTEMLQPGGLWPDREKFEAALSKYHNDIGTRYRVQRTDKRKGIYYVCARQHHENSRASRENKAAKDAAGEGQEYQRVVPAEVCAGALHLKPRKPKFMNKVAIDMLSDQDNLDTMPIEGECRDDHFKIERLTPHTHGCANHRIRSGRGVRQSAYTTKQYIEAGENGSSAKGLLRRNRKASSASVAAVAQQALGHGTKFPDNTRAAIYKIAKRSIEGTHEQQFKVLISTLEHLKECDSHMRITCVTLNAPREIISFRIDDQPFIESLTPAQRFDSYTVELGSAVRLAKYEGEGRSKIYMMDAAHLSGPLRGMVAISVFYGPDREVLVGGFSTTSHQEDNVLWTHHIKGSNNIYLQDDLLVSDRKKGLKQVLQREFPHARKAACIKHLKDNMRDYHNGTEEDLMLFDLITRARTESKFQELVQLFRKQAKPKTINFLEGIISEGGETSKEHWASAYFKGERERVFTTQAAESLNGSLLQLGVRELPFREIAHAIVQREQARLVQLRDKYAKLNAENKVVGPKTEQFVQQFITKANDYDVVVVRPLLKAQVIWKGGNSSIVHDVDFGNIYENSANFSSKDCVCSCGNFRLLGVPCAAACAFAKKQNIDPLTLCRPVYLVRNGIKLINCMLTGFSAPSSLPSYEDLKTHPLRVPLVAAQSGRPKKRRYVKGERKKGKGRKRQKCDTCGEQGHNSVTCRSRTDGEGTALTVSAFNKLREMKISSFQIGPRGETEFPVMNIGEVQVASKKAQKTRPASEKASSEPAASASSASILRCSRGGR